MLKGHKTPAKQITAELQISSCINISTNTVHQELHGLGYHDWAAPVDVQYSSVHLVQLE